MRAALFLTAAIALTACGETAKLDVAQGMGANPELPEPNETMFPTVNIADPSPWAEGEMPTAAPGFTVSEYAGDLESPRWMYRLPNGDLLVAETRKPPEEASGIRAWIEKKVMSSAGAGGLPPNRITLLRDSDANGVVDETHVFLTEGLASPFGMSLVGNTFYVANFAGLRAYSYEAGATSITDPGRDIAAFPVIGEKAGHWTRNLLASPDGAKLYVAIGSVSNVMESNPEVEEGRAAIHEYNIASGEMRLFATGLRNPVGMDWNPASGELWTAVNERDMLGSDLVPDYMTSVKDGGFYGWPYSYFGQIEDTRPANKRPDLVAKAIKPDYALGPHTASLGLAFTPGGGGAVVGQHGSWNRKPHSGYKVVYIPFAGAQPSGPAQDLLTGFLVGETAKGRPVGVTFDRTGALLVADDVGDKIWRVAPDRG